MRFYADGPSIPDELLITRDEGRVVFFCGAGVSRAKANLADFFGLAASVLHELGVLEGQPARKLLNAAKVFGKYTGIEGLISADRVFGLLERDFLTRDIAAAVSKALKPTTSVDLSAHRIILDLATTAEGNLQLVTTNFDRLFESSAPEARIWYPPRLPNPARQGEINGIIHLHGCVNTDYSGAEADGFVLSSSEFGRAYLSDGWATSFFREIISRYSVVFIGYAADDPPVQYLLEALNKTSGQLNGVYAFQGGTSDSAAARWRHKGIEAIHYAEEGNHSRLWDTLEAWAKRAQNPDAWHASVLTRALDGPAALRPHERGQIAHIVSTVEGARKFASCPTPAPADWLCVFDPALRFAKPSHKGHWGDRGPYVDPFELYGLDSDAAPKSIEPDDHYAKREIPADAWDGLRLNKLDQQNSKDLTLSSLRGPWSTNPTRLTGRLAFLGRWIRQVSDQPAAVWWAVRQGGLHPDIMSDIRWRLGHGNEIASPVMRTAWRYLMEIDYTSKHEDYRDWDDLKSLVAREGWSNVAIRRYADNHRPHLTVDRAWMDAVPPDRDFAGPLHDLMRLDVKYPEPQEHIEVPDEYLVSLIKALRRNLELAVILETELGGYALTNVVPINPDENLEGETSYSRGHGLSFVVLRFCDLLRRLCSLEPAQALTEFNSWPRDEQTIFCRLRLWMSGITNAIPDRAFIGAIDDMDDDAFWSSHHQRDFMFALKNRWSSLKVAARRKIERRIIKGRGKWISEKRAEYKERRVRLTLNRLSWLMDNGCQLSKVALSKVDDFKRTIADWDPAQAESAARSIESRSGWVRTETDASGLIGIPLGSILAKAQELSGRGHDFVEKAPFSGFSASHPVRAFAILRKSFGDSKLPVWAWDRFLHSDARKTDKPKFVAYIAARLIHASDKQLSELIRHICDWLSDSYEMLSNYNLTCTDRLLDRLSHVLSLKPTESDTGIVRGDKDPDWTMESINSATGKLAQALFHDPRKNNLNQETGFSAEWLRHVEKLLALPGDLRRHALVIFAHNLNWFHYYDAAWTEKHLLSVLDGSEGDDRDAFLSGFFWAANIPHSIPLYHRMKSSFISCVHSSLVSRRKYEEVLVGMLLAGWASNDKDTGARLISDDEMRKLILDSDDEFRTRILWQIRTWSGRGTSERSDDADQEEKHEKEDRKRWSEHVPDFLVKVWPRHKVAKSSAISAGLLELAFSNSGNFQEIAQIILPLLVPMEQNHVFMSDLNKRRGGIVDRYPEELLSLLYSALPEDIRKWPYGSFDVLKQISTNHSKLRSDPRLLELIRKWNSA